MKKNILSLVLLGVFMTGCSSMNDEVVINDEVANGELPKEEQSIVLDNSGLISDEIAIIEISEDTYLEELNELLTEDGYTMRIDEASEFDKDHVLKNNIIHFNFDSSEISEEMKEVILSQISFLQKYPKIKVILEGHTDERGSNAYNVVLGEKRAKAVKEILLKSGISESQIEVISYGELKPIDNGSTEESWKKNRRAVFIYK